MTPLVEKLCFKQVLEEQLLEADYLLYGMKRTVYFVPTPFRLQTSSKDDNWVFNNSSMFTIKLKLPLDLQFFCCVWIAL